MTIPDFTRLNQISREILAKAAGDEDRATAANAKAKEYRTFRRKGQEHPDLGRVPRNADIAAQEMERDRNTYVKTSDL